MRSVLFLAIAALALFAGLSAASPASAAHVASSSDLLAQYVENEPSAMFSRRQLAERPSRVKSKKLAARASPTPVSYDYNIQILSADGSFLGYLTHNVNEYWSYSTSKKDALAIAAPSIDDYSNMQFASSGNNMVAPTVGPAATSDAMGHGYFNYVFFTATVATPPGSVPVVVSNEYNTAYGTQRKSESAIWKYYPSNGLLDVAWVNTNGPRVSMGFLIGTKYNYLMATGDVDKFLATFNDQRYDRVTLKLVKI